MAMSASRSATRRGNPERNVSGQIRSRSVSAFPTRTRSGADLPVQEEFTIKRDNPLFCSSSASSSLSSSPPEYKTREEDWGRRGRSAARSSGIGTLGKSARSLSRVDTGRRRLRSVSREPRGSFERDIENGYGSASNSRNKESGTSTTYRRCKSEYDWKEQTKNLQTWTSQHPVSKSWDTSSRDHSVEDNGTDAIYETVRSEVRRAVSEIRNDLENVIQRENPAITTENIVDIPPELLNPDMVELVTEVRREYATKLEQSQERARKLRADLAVEQQREQELSRILVEIHQAPKSYGSRKCRPKRRASIERLRMSRDLAEEAMNYFDECVSISTFDSSEFSSLEDPQPGMPVGSSRFFPNEGSIISGSNFGNRDTNHHEDLDYQTQCSLSSTGSELAISSSYSSTKPAHIHVNNNHDDDLGNYGTLQSGNFQFSFAREPTEPAVINDDIRQYIKKFGKETRKERTEYANARSTYNPEDYDLSSKAEILLLDRLILGNRMESGGLLVCDIRTF